MALSKIPKSIIREINQTTSVLIGKGLAVHQNFPATFQLAGQVYISWGNQGTLSSTFKNIPYADAYKSLLDSKSYNILMMDGSLVQMMYCFQGNDLLSHRLAFYPCPDLPQFVENPDFYNLRGLEDEIYRDIIDRDILVFPFRFDYAPAQFEDTKHPKSHLHLGEYKNCRIPLSLPLTPNVFIDFLLRNFYSDIFYQGFTGNDLALTRIFQDCISQNESKLVHLNIRI